MVPRNSQQPQLFEEITLKADEQLLNNCPKPHLAKTQNGQLNTKKGTKG